MRLALDSLPERYAFLDPAGGKQRVLKRVAAESAIVVGAVDAIGRVFVPYAWSGRIEAPKLLDKIHEVNGEWKPRLFGVEANAMQALFADLVAHDAKLRQIRLPIIPVEQPTNVDKDFRIRMALQPMVGNGRLILGQGTPGLDALKAQILGFPLIQVKDLIDALASMLKLIPPRTAQVEADWERRGLDEYLRETDGMLGNEPDGEWGDERYETMA